jgi:polar amino acid transport system substrate-binding protein
MDSLTSPYVLAHETEKFVTVGEPLEYQVMGIGVSKDDKALQKDLAAALQKLIDDGTYAKLLQKWNLSASSALTKVTLNGTEAK